MIDLQILLAFANGLSCGLMCTRMLTYRRNGAKFNRSASLLAYLLIIASGTVAIRIAFSEYRIIDPAETLLNLVLCMAVFRARGNVSQLFYGERSQ
ncbi:MULTISPECIES: phage holin family protein [unclassified Serratia (in: enterobacteria)]|uniref:phage holin family protein n=1 Tax=unclassified Serratia (in: enterobacteria) TaxID=2647522 RepID=UPI0004A81202|nr:MULTISPECIES: phage holin family protein [unclassified Serratia (in: enterobacteria)]